jgi:hypothetical protein
MNEEIYVVVESSKAGESVIGVFSTIEKARAVLPSHDIKRMLEDYRIELHVLDYAREENEPWLVVLSRDGQHTEVHKPVLCNCGDDHEQLDHASYLESGGGPMHLVVWARTQGDALLAAERHRVELIDADVWRGDEVPLRQITAGPA